MILQLLKVIVFDDHSSDLKKFPSKNIAWTIRRIVMKVAELSNKIIV